MLQNKVKLSLYFNYIIKPCHEGMTSVIDGGE
jgi:hypothetical protein